MNRLLPTFLALSFAAASFAGSAHATALWAGANATNSGFGVHAGAALLPVPLVGTLGWEGRAERGWADGANRIGAGLTLRDLNLPFTGVDAFATLGGEFVSATTNAGSASGWYAEAGLRAPLFGPAGWRAFVRSGTISGLGAGLGLEIRF